MIEFRHYQTESINAFWDYFRNGGVGNPLLCLPTGTGKSVVLAGCIKSILSRYKTQRILALVHTKELVEQNWKKFAKLCPEVHSGIFSAGLNRKEGDAQVIFGGVGSVVKAIDKLGHFDLIFVDEAHMISQNDETMYRKIVSSVNKKNKYIKVIGLTATPWRAGLGLITDEGGLFTDIICDWTSTEKFNQLISEGFLCSLVPLRTDTVLNVEGVKTRGGDFVEADLQAAVNKDDITRAALNECLAHKHERKSWLIFGAGVDHCLRIEAILNELGVSAKAVWSSRKEKDLDENGRQIIGKNGKPKTKTISMPDKQRDSIISDFKAGKFQAIISNGILTTGFDHPPVDFIVMLRPTRSIVLWVQMLGRGTRPYDPTEAGDGIDTEFFDSFKFNCLVMDFAGNTKRLGQINDPYIPNRKGKKGGNAPVKECPVCGNLVHATSRQCPGQFPSGALCTHEFVIETKIKSKASSEELIKGDLPIVESFKVNHIDYSKASYPKGTAMKIAYHCGRRTFYENVCLEYEGGAKNMAKLWIRNNLIDGYKLFDLINTVDDLLKNVDAVKLPTHLRVHVNLKYPKILAKCFDGSNFETEAEQDDRPTIDTHKDLVETVLRQAGEIVEETLLYEDEEIPF